MLDEEKATGRCGLAAGAGFAVGLAFAFGSGWPVMISTVGLISGLAGALALAFVALAVFFDTLLFFLLMTRSPLAVFRLAGPVGRSALYAGHMCCIRRRTSSQ